MKNKEIEFLGNCIEANIIKERKIEKYRWMVYISYFLLGSSFTLDSLSLFMNIKIYYGSLFSLLMMILSVCLYAKFNKVKDTIYFPKDSVGKIINHE